MTSSDKPTPARSHLQVSTHIPPKGVLRIQRLHPEAKMPVRAYSKSIGLDVAAFLLTEEGKSNTTLVPQQGSRTIPTGLSLCPPDGYAVFVCSRSGLAQQSIFVANSPGVVDPDYRGELKVILFNGSHQSHYVRHGDRIAQLVILPAPIIEFEEAESLPGSERGDRGFGSTGGFATTKR